ncbi:PIN domain-containing protein [Calditrichota bacterium LG25]
MDDVIVIDINSKIKEIAMDIRNKKRLKLPDAINAATALYLNIPLITADKEFDVLEEPQVILYKP